MSHPEDLLRRQVVKLDHAFTMNRWASRLNTAACAACTAAFCLFFCGAVVAGWVALLLTGAGFSLAEILYRAVRAVIDEALDDA